MATAPGREGRARGPGGHGPSRADGDGHELPGGRARRASHADRPPHGGGRREGTAGHAYTDGLSWLYGRQRLGIRLGLEKVERLLSDLGDPQDSFRCVHVAGTNGKGSVTHLLGDVLRRAGVRTGVTTSPHLVRFAERIEVDGNAVPEDDLARHLATLRPAVESLDALGTPPTFFECVTALAFLAFRDAGVDWAVVETGMGGRLDATNVLRPDLTIITNVTLDHEAHLGNTVAEIAFEKGGIMKAGTPCVTAARGEALRVLKAMSHGVQAPMSVVGEDYHVVADPGGLRLVTPRGEARYGLALGGAHQLENAAVVCAAVDALRMQGVDVPDAALRQAFAQAHYPGRLERFNVDARDGRVLEPPRPHAHTTVPSRADAAAPGVEILLDGAHNVAAAQALADHLEAAGWDDHDLVVGFNADKAWRAALALWAPPARHVWGVPVRNPRTLDPAMMEDELRGLGRPFKACQDAAAALAAARKAGARRIVVAGSLFLVGEARAHLTGASLEEIRGAQ